MKEKIITKFSNVIHNTVMDQIRELKSDPSSKEVYLNGKISYDEIIIKIDEIAYLGEIHDIINKLKGRDRIIRYDNRTLGEALYMNQYLSI